MMRLAVTDDVFQWINSVGRYGVMDQQSYFRSNDWNNRRYSMHAHIGTTLAKGLDVDVLAY